MRLSLVIIYLPKKTLKWLKSSSEFFKYIISFAAPAVTAAKESWSSYDPLSASSNVQIANPKHSHGPRSTGKASLYPYHKASEVSGPMQNERAELGLGTMIRPVFSGKSSQ